MRAEVSVVRAVGGAVRGIRAWIRARSRRSDAAVASFRRCLLRTAAPLECAAWCRAIGVKSVSLELVF